MSNHLTYMKEAYKEAIKAYNQDEVPVGAIIVHNDEIIARGYNNRQKSQCALGHAELIAIKQASKVLNSWRLEECTLYVTMEPCIMCSGAIIQSRIKKVVYGASDTRWMSLKKVIENEDLLNHQVEVLEGVLEEECSKLVKQYFKDKR